MTKINAIDSIWFPKKKLIETKISGLVKEKDIIIWKDSLIAVLNKLEDGEVFKIFINTYGLETENLITQKAYRSIIPLMISNFGWKVGYTMLYEHQESLLSIQNIRGIQCKAAAHLHHDKIKMDYFDKKFGNNRERFFSNPKSAEHWIDNVEITL